MFKVIEGLLVKNHSSARAISLMRQENFPELAEKEAPRHIAFMEVDEEDHPAVDSIRFEEKVK